MAAVFPVVGSAHSTQTRRIPRHLFLSFGRRS